MNRVTAFVYHLPWRVYEAIERVAKSSDSCEHLAFGTKEYVRDVGPFGFIHNYMPAFGGHGGSQIQFRRKPIITSAMTDEGMALDFWPGFVLLAERENALEFRRIRNDELASR